MRAANTLAGLLACPVAGALLVHRGAQWALKRLTGASRCLRQLRSGILQQQLKALAGILSGALTSAGFRRELCRRVSPISPSAV